MSNKGIKAKLILSLIVTTLLVLTVFFVILNGYLKDYSKNEAEETILLMAKMGLSEPLFRGTPEESSQRPLNSSLEV